MRFRPIGLFVVLGLGITVLSCQGEAQSIRIDAVESAPSLVSLPLVTGGRMLSSPTEKGGSVYRFQWPGIYFAGAFSGETVFIRTGQGDAILHVQVDDSAVIPLTKPHPGIYQVVGLAKGSHTIRVELVTESQSASMDFGGLAVTDGKLA